MKHRFFGRLTLALMTLEPSFAAELPVRQVILYKHGVGYFERSGTVAPNDPVRLDFKAGEMNDVLKSLSINEKGGTKVSGLRYDSSIPLKEKLAEFPFKIEAGQALSSLLDQLRGARVELQFGTEKISGIIVGARATAALPPPAASPAREQITLLLEGGDFKTYDLAAASGIHFSDTKLQSQFRDYLTAVAAGRSVEKRSLFIDASKISGPRDITASYIVPSPVWKSSYRLILDATQPPILEGWAIVDNTTGEDWIGVRMSLVSGKPVSFISELYEPKYIDRPTANLPEEQAQKPVVYARGMRMDKANPAAPAPPLGPMTEAVKVSASLPRIQTEMAQRSPSAIAQEALSQERGDLFEYAIATPVTVRKNESAMLPFLQDKIEARRLLIYTEGASHHPLQAAELKNTTGKTLDGGPITVFDANTYAGEALVETLKNADKSLISYAVDLGTIVTTAFDSRDAVIREVHLTHGVLTQRLAEAETKTYTVSNVDPKAKTLIIEHSKRPDYDLLSPKQRETTPDGYRFEVALAPHGSAKLVVSEERVYNSSVTVSSLRNDQIGAFLQNKTLSNAARRLFTSIVAVKNQIADFDRKIAAETTQIDSLNNDTKRLRENIATLNGVSGQQTQVQTYANRLASLETAISAASDDRKALQSQRAASQSALDVEIASLEF